MEFHRYAIYFTPSPGALERFGAAWLGWDMGRGQAEPHPDVAGVPRPVGELTETPRRYGLHATMKPPFRLAKGASEGGLRAALVRFCAASAPVVLGGLTLEPMGRFLALQPKGDTGQIAALNRLAADTVRAFDAFRAALSAEDLERRRKSGLSPAQEANLLRWGYPHVMEAFRFHITLTGPLPRPELEVVTAALRPHLSGVLDAPFAVDALSLAGEDGEGRFHLIHRQALTG